MSVKKFAALLVILVATLVLVFSVGSAEGELTPKEELGKFLYFDENLSEPAGQSCASCHLPEAGFVDPDSNLPVSEGVIEGRFGNRNSPASAHAMYAPIFHFDEGEGLWIGGQFWDGRATGEVLGDPLADQALGAFLNKLEMNNPDKATVIADVAASDYATLFEEVWGPGALDNVESAYDRVALSIATFERTALFGQFTSKYDHYLAACLDVGDDMDDCAQGIGKVPRKAGKKFFTKEEWYGFQLFMGDNNNDGVLTKGEGAFCVACHVTDWTADPGNVVVPYWAPEGWVPPMFTDFTFDNLGVPKNPKNPFYYLPPELNPDGEDFVDYGLGGFLQSSGYDAEVYEPELGKVKVMTLRNIGLTAPYSHNGFFNNLKEITHFYNTRDVAGALKKGEDWPEPEYPSTVNFDELGNLGLSDDDEDALVEFMKTLSDGWTP